ncbi:MAG: hypothetical protein JWP74_3352 [Marmoricola sp.]|nr:hypothetical protein [Marmoricola sp.]
MNLKRFALPVAMATVAFIAIGPSSATPTTTDHDIRASDFIPGLTDTRSGGHEAFLKEGIHVSTDSNTSNDKVAEYFAVNKPLAGITDIGYEWYGTDPSPGQQYVMDFDNDGTPDGILVGENVYGGQDVWLSNGSKDAYKGAGAPSNTGGSGSANHGTLAQWSAMYPNAQILDGGFSLGSGVKGDGVLRSLTYGPDRYVFTDEAPVVVPVPPTTNPVTSSGTWDNGTRLGRFLMRTPTIPGNDTGKGTKVHWEIYLNGQLRYSAYVSWGSYANWQQRFAKNIGPQVINVKKNGVDFGTRTVTTAG